MSHRAGAKPAGRETADPAPDPDEQERGVLRGSGQLRDPAVLAATHRAKRQSLRGFVCPKDRGELRLRKDGSGVNECPECGAEFITEWEYQRRQREAAK